MNEKPKSKIIGRFRRFPAAGTRDSVTGLSSSILTKWRRNGWISVSIIKDPGASKGVVMLDGESVETFLESQKAPPGAMAADTHAAVERRKEIAGRKNHKPFPANDLIKERKGGKNAL